jgi:hypothetical protein
MIALSAAALIVAVQKMKNAASTPRENKVMTVPRIQI